MLFKVYFRKFQTFIKLRNIWNLHVYSLNIYSILSILFNLVSIHFLNTVLALVAQLCPTLCDPMDCSPPGSSVHGILQVRMLQWVAMPSSRGTSRPRHRTHTSYTGRQCAWSLAPLGKSPSFDHTCFKSHWVCGQSEKKWFKNHNKEQGGQLFYKKMP